MRASRKLERQQREQAQQQQLIEQRQRERAVRQAISQIAEALGETADKPRALIERIIGGIGLDAALAFLQQTEQIEADGGMLLPDGSRRRTKGGVFFFLVRQQLQAEQRRDDIKRIFT